MSNSTETIGKLFDYAIELEKATEILYRQMGKMLLITMPLNNFGCILLMRNAGTHPIWNVSGQEWTLNAYPNHR